MEDTQPQIELPKQEEADTQQTQKLSDDGSAQSTFDERSVSRIGRVRKPKILYDPSDVDSKRRSLPNMEVKKPKPQPPAPKTSEIDNENPSSTKPTTDPTTAADDPFKKPCNQTLSPSQIKANNIHKRRQTIGPANFENGCIVCTRSDTNKGRLVNCMDCIKRGHFTCLRTAKLFKTADTEKTWQCPTCKICEVCGDHEPVTDLIKCLTCYNSYHSKCIDINPKQVVRKRFTCTLCVRIDAKKSEASESTAIEVPKLEALDIIRTTEDGFAGFSGDESTKRKCNENQAMAVKAKKAKKQKSANENEREIKLEPQLYALGTKMREENPNPSSRAAHNENTVSVRKDLVSKCDDDLMNDLDDSAELQYNTKTAIKPHEDVPDVKTWDCDTVYVYFRSKTNDEYANLLKENQIDGDALLLIKREDVLNRFNLKLGPALRLYSHIVALQCRNNNPILAWN